MGWGDLGGYQKTFDDKVIRNTLEKNIQQHQETFTILTERVSHK